MRSKSFLISLLPLLAAAPTPSAAQDASSGERLFRTRCATCHAIEPGQKRTGPHLQGIVGRQSATVEGVAYSNGLQALNVVWNVELLDQFLSNPTAMAKGTRMSIRVPNPSDRANIISYLQSLAPAAQ